MTIGVVRHLGRHQYEMGSLLHLAERLARGPALRARLHAALDALRRGGSRRPRETASSIMTIRAHRGRCRERIFPSALLACNVETDSIIMPMEGVMKLTKNERVELRRQANARNGRADSARHARLILLLADGLTWAEIGDKLDCGDSYISP